MSELFFQFIRQIDGRALSLLLIPAIWVVFVLGRLLPINRYGLVPRKRRGLIGVASMPFLHSDFRHLMSNTVPLTVLLSLLILRLDDAATNLYTVFVISLFGGTLLWLFGRPAVHIGASLLVFGLTGFHIANGLLEGRVSSIVIAIVVAGLYGTTLLGAINPFKLGVSWEGHLFGFIAGAVVGALYTGDLILYLPV